MASPVEQFDAVQVERIVLEFYHAGTQMSPQGNSSRAVNHDWLNRAQMSSSAWQFAWDLVKLDKNPEVQFFGANTLVIKVSALWNDIAW